MGRLLLETWGADFIQPADDDTLEVLLIRQAGLAQAAEKTSGTANAMRRDLACLNEGSISNLFSPAMRILFNQR
jgi:hypothetical protein